MSSLRSVSASFQFHGVHKTSIKIVAIIKFAATSPKTTISPYEGLVKRSIVKPVQEKALGFNVLVVLAVIIILREIIQLREGKLGRSLKVIKPNSVGHYSWGHLFSWLLNEPLWKVFRSKTD